MMDKVQDLLDTIKEHDDSPDGVAFELRLDFADLINRGLDANGWSQKQLAEKAGMTEAAISVLARAGRNFTVETLGRVLYALGFGAELKQAPLPGRARPAARTLTLTTTSETTHGTYKEFQGFISRPETPGKARIIEAGSGTGRGAIQARYRATSQG
jgi:transcriptional regulator with XRE-family HTH domain